jgi:hypothetical protein
MLSFIKKLFGFKPAEAESTAPYKVEPPVVEAATAPQAPAKVSKPRTQKKPAVVAKTARKPRAPKV